MPVTSVRPNAFRDEKVDSIGKTFSMRLADASLFQEHHQIAGRQNKNGHSAQSSSCKPPSRRVSFVRLNITAQLLRLRQLSVQALRPLHSLPRPHRCAPLRSAPSPPLARTVPYMARQRRATRLLHGPTLMQVPTVRLPGNLLRLLRIPCCQRQARVLPRYLTSLPSQKSLQVDC